jgi:hypothetical protein
MDDDGNGLPTFKNGVDNLDAMNSWFSANTWLNLSMYPRTGDLGGTHHPRGSNTTAQSTAKTYPYSCNTSDSKVVHQELNIYATLEAEFHHSSSTTMEQ